MAKFNKDASETSYAGINLTIQVNGETVNLGSLFVTNKGATKVAKKVYELIESGQLKPESVQSIEISGVFSSEDLDSSLDLTANSFA